MNLDMLKSKLHQACVTDANVMYEGSMGIDRELMEAVGLYRYEKILVSNMNNGSRLETYVIPEPFGSRKIVLNGAAARLGAVGDRVIIMSFCAVEESQVRDGSYKPNVIRLDENNDPVDVLSRRARFTDIGSMLGS
ncbi:MAG: aspartate 1-decarboxylase [Phycisphaerae bacterium]